MANERILDKIIQIDGNEYQVTAATADKVAHKLTIKTAKNGVETSVDFDGSKDEEITISASGGEANSAEQADTIQVKLDNEKTVYATINIRTSDPTSTDGKLGDIWFKYAN